MSKCLINSWINSYSYQQCMRVSFISHTYRPLYLHFYHPVKCIMIFHCDLNLHFLVTNDEISLQRFSGHLDAFWHEALSLSYFTLIKRFFSCHFKIGFFIFLLLLFSHPVMSNSLWPHGLQHARPPYPSPSPKVCPSSCPLHWGCHLAILFSDAIFSFCPQSFSASRTFPKSAVCVKWPKYWSFSFSPSNEYSGLVSF